MYNIWKEQYGTTLMWTGKDDKEQWVGNKKLEDIRRKLLQNEKDIEVDKMTILLMVLSG